MAESKNNNADKSDIGRFIGRALELGAKNAKIISPDSIVTAPWVEMRCQYGCPLYAKRLSCPPYSPTHEKTREIIDCYKTAVLVQGENLVQVSSLAVALEREIFLAGYYKAMGMGAGPCVKCETCLLEKGCKFPIDVRPAMEACGIDVYQTVRNNDWGIEVVETHEHTQQDFGVVLVE